MSVCLFPVILSNLEDVVKGYGNSLHESYAELHHAIYVSLHGGIGDSKLYFTRTTNSLRPLVAILGPA